MILVEVDAAALQRTASLETDRLCSLRISVVT